MQRRRYSYGPDDSQYAELFLPDRQAHPGVVVIIHGGYWRAEYGADLGMPLAEDLAARGQAAWNLEYRRIGNGGGWPRTFDDVAAGIDLLADAGPASGLNPGPVRAVGHSAGGQLAVWAAGRTSPRVRLDGVISQAGLLDLGSADAAGLSNKAVAQLLGGSRDDMPERYAAVDPILRLPLDIPVYCLHDRADDAVPYAQSAAYVAAARARGGVTELVDVNGGHYGLIDPAAPAWQATWAALLHFPG